MLTKKCKNAIRSSDSPTKKNLQPWPSSPAPGTIPLGTKSTLSFTTSSAHGLRIEVEETPASMATTWHSQSASNQRPPCVYYRSRKSLVQGRSAPATNLTYFHLLAMPPLRAEKNSRAASSSDAQLETPDKLIEGVHVVTPSSKLQHLATTCSATLLVDLPNAKSLISLGKPKHCSQQSLG